MSDETSMRDDTEEELSDIPASGYKAASNAANLASQVNNYAGNYNSKAKADTTGKGQKGPSPENLTAKSSAKDAGNITSAGKGAASSGTAAGGAAASGGAAATGATAGAAAGPGGAIVGAIIGAAVQAGKALKNASDVSMDQEDSNAPKMNMLIFVFAGFMLFITVFCGTLLSKGIASVFSVNQETEFQNTKYDGENMSKAGERFKKDASSPLNDYDDKYPLSNSIMDYVWGTDTHKGFRNVCMEAINENLTATVMSLEDTIPDKEWDGHRTMSHFYNLPWPYDLQKSKNEIYPSIGDVLHPDPGGDYDISEYNGEYLAKFDDVNWAEVITILSQNVKEDDSHKYALNWGECNYEDFQKFIESDRCKDYMYELGVKWIPIYTGKKKVKNEDGTYTEIEIRGEGDEYDDPESCGNAPETMEINGIECVFTDFWTKTEVRPFGLRELYALADVVPENKNVEFNMHTNYDMLDYTENITRLYARGKKVTFKSGGTANQLGPAYNEKRSELSTIIDFLNNDEMLKKENKAGQGRSCWYYIETTYRRDLSTIDFRTQMPAYESATPPKSVKLSGSLAQKLALYFPDGIPTSPEEMKKYLTTITVVCHGINGEDVTYNLTVHKMVAESLKAGMQALYDSGFVVKSMGSYSWRDMVGSAGHQSMHSYGLAVDINPEENPFYKNGKIYAGTSWNPKTNPLSISQETADNMIQNGWYWGGNWNSSKDYMHFSVTGY